METKISRQPFTQLTLGFVLVLALLAAIVGMAIFGLDRLMQGMDRISTENNVHSHLAVEMLQASRERGVLLGKIVLEEDPFARDEIIQNFTGLGRQFGAARTRLLASPDLIEVERALLEEQRQLAAQVQPLQMQVIELAVAERNAEAAKLLLGDVLPIQERMIVTLRQFTAFQENEVAEIVRQAQQANERGNLLLLASGALAMLAGAAIAVFVSRRMRGLVAAIERRERESRTLLENIPDLVWFKDRDARFKWANPAFTQAAGIAPDRLGGLRDEDIWLAGEAVQCQSDEQRAIASGQTVQVEKTFTIHGQARRFDTSRTPVYGEQGLCAGVLCVAHDITEQRRMEQQVKTALRELEFQKYALDQHAIVSIADVSGRITYVNDKFCAVSGYGRDELIGQNHRLLKSGAHPDDFFTDMWGAIVSGRVWHGEVCNRKKNGASYWVDTSIVPFMDEQGLPYQYISIRTEITGLKYIEQVLKKTNEALHVEALEKSAEAREREELVVAISTAAHDAVVVIDDAGKVVYWNQAAEKLFGYGAAEALSQDLHRLVMPDGHAEQQAAGFARFIESGEGALIGRATEVSARRKDGAEFDLELSLSALKMKGRWHGVGIGRDVTARKQEQQSLQRRNEELLVLNDKLKEAQNQLLQSEKMASVGQLAAGVAHEINNPIGYVYSNLGTLQNYVQDIFKVVSAYEGAEPAIADDELLSQVRKAKAQADLNFLREDVLSLMHESREGITRVKKIVQDLKDFSHVDTSDEWHWTDLHAGLDTTLNIVWNELKYKAEVKKEYGDIPEVECLPSQLNQVFLNMLVNAGHAIEERGAITLRTGRAGDEVWVEIADTGKGIAPEHLQRIFEPFFTTKPIGKGTGLGLSLSYGIVQKHGGRIEVQSEPGKGTAFKIWLPVKQREPAEAAAVDG
ncbi:MAG: PAS domain S-box protein [Hydrogenophilales bacterium]|nr:PAS domain S-box protein [Hydrogenophilales bacterium]